MDAEHQYDVRIYMCILTLPLIFLNWIRNLKYLAPISMVANVLQSASIIVVFYYIFRDGLPPMHERPAFGSWAGLPLYFGTAVFAFEGIPLVLPLQKEMKTPRDFEGWTGILNTGMVIVTCIYLAMGFYGTQSLDFGGADSKDESFRLLEVRLGNLGQHHFELARRGCTSAVRENLTRSRHLRQLCSVSFKR